MGTNLILLLQIFGLLELLKQIVAVFLILYRIVWFVQLRQWRYLVLFCRDSITTIWTALNSTQQLKRTILAFNTIFFSLVHFLLWVEVLGIFWMKIVRQKLKVLSICLKLTITFDPIISTMTIWIALMVNKFVCLVWCDNFDVIRGVCLSFIWQKVTDLETAFYHVICRLLSNQVHRSLRIEASCAYLTQSVSIFTSFYSSRCWTSSIYWLLMMCGNVLICRRFICSYPVNLMSFWTFLSKMLTLIDLGILHVISCVVIYKLLIIRLQQIFLLLAWLFSSRFYLLLVLFDKICLEYAVLILKVWWQNLEFSFKWRHIFVRKYCFRVHQNMFLALIFSNRLFCIISTWNLSGTYWRKVRSAASTLMPLKRR